MDKIDFSSVDVKLDKDSEPPENDHSVLIEDSNTMHANGYLIGLGYARLFVIDYIIIIYIDGNRLEDIGRYNAFVNRAVIVVISSRWDVGKLVIKDGTFRLKLEPTNLRLELSTSWIVDRVSEIIFLGEEVNNSEANEVAVLEKIDEN